MVMSGWQGSEPCKGIPACSSQRAWLPSPACQPVLGQGFSHSPRAAVVPWGWDLGCCSAASPPQAAGNAVKRASDNLVKAAQKAAAFQDHDETVVVKEKMVGGIAQVRSGAAAMGQGWLRLPPQPVCACLGGACPTTHQHRARLWRASQSCCGCS